MLPLRFVFVIMRVNTTFNIFLGRVLMDQHLEEMLKMDEESRIAYLKAFTRLA